MGFEMELDPLAPTKVAIPTGFGLEIVDLRNEHPIILDLDADGIEVTGLDRSTSFFDSADDGLMHRTARAGSGWRGRWGAVL